MKVLALSAESDSWVRAYRAVNTLVEYGVPVLWGREETSVSGKGLPRGVFIFPLDEVLSASVADGSMQAAAPLSEAEIEEYLKSERIPVVKGELSDPVNVYSLSPSRVAVYADSGGYNHASIASACGLDVEFIDGRQIAAGALERFSILMSGGGGRWRKATIFNENVLLTAMGVEGAKRISEFVRGGGAYLGCCGGSYMATVVRERFMNWWHPAKRYMTMMNVEDWHIDEFSGSGFKSPGMGMFTARNVASQNPTMFGVPEIFECTHYNGPIFNLIEQAVEQASSATPVAVCDTVSAEKFTPSEFFYSSDDVSSLSLEETGFHRACRERRPVIVQGLFGVGLVVLSGSHPEISPPGVGIRRDDWWDSARIIGNVALWSTARSGRKVSRRIGLRPSRIPIAPQRKLAAPLISRIEEAAKALKIKSQSPLPIWLRWGVAPRSYGLSLEGLWVAALGRLPLLCGELLAQFEVMDRLTEEVLGVKAKVAEQAGRIRDEEVKRVCESLRVRAMDVVFSYYDALGYERPPLWDEAGYQGVYRLLNTAEARCRLAVENLDAAGLCRADLEANPYSNLTRADSMLFSALKLLRIHESAMEKYLATWRLIKKATQRAS